MTKAVYTLTILPDARTVRERFAAGCPCTHCVHCVGFVRYTETTSGGHTCQLSVIGTESPSFSSRQNLRPRRPKSPSFEHRWFFYFCFSFPAIISYFPGIIPISVVGRDGVSTKWVAMCRKFKCKKKEEIVQGPL